MAENPTDRFPRSMRVERNARNRIDGYALMRTVADGEAALVVLDPQYRAVLDKQGYGNEGKRQAKRAALQPMSSDDIGHFVAQAVRVLRPSGHLVLWMDKFSLASAHYHFWLDRAGGEAGTFRIVDLFAWNKGRIGMGSRGRGLMEYAVIAQKLPTRAKGIWIDRGMGDGFLEPKNLNGHPHAKPRAWTERLIRSITKPGDLVVDPCAGGYGVLDACANSGRQFVGGDLEG